MVKNYQNVNILMTRETDKYLELSQRSKFANDANADLFISVHINAGGGTGFESYVYNKNETKEAIEAQRIIHDHVVNKVNVGRDRGKKNANYHVVRETKMPAVLFEYLFIDNKNDANKLKNNSFINQLAKATAEGIAIAMGLPRK